MLIFEKNHDWNPLCYHPWNWAWTILGNHARNHSWICLDHERNSTRSQTFGTFCSDLRVQFFKSVQNHTPEYCLELGMPRHRTWPDKWLEICFESCLKPTQNLIWVAETFAEPCLRYAQNLAWDMRRTMPETCAEPCLRYAQNHVWCMDWTISRTWAVESCL
jgi:hypothetical protein